MFVNTKHALAIAAIAAATLLAASPKPSTSASPSPPALAPFSATGTVAASGASAEGKKGTLDAEIRVAHRDTRWRIDLLKANATADDPMIKAMAAMLPQMAITIVADPAAKRLRIWTAARPVYFETALEMPKPKPSPKTSPSPSPIWNNVMKSLDSMTHYDSFSQSFALVGHQTVNGRSASLYHFTSQMQKHGGTMQTVTGDLAFADDLSGLPIHLLVDFKAAALGHVAIDLTGISNQPPDAAQFVPPPGYKRTNDFFALLNGPSAAPHKP